MDAMADKGLTRTRIVIVGAGFGGIGLGIRLKAAGLNEFLILEKSDSVGGVWRENRYPGSACDAPSHLYSFSFEPRADWPHRFAKQPDILDYLEHCARKYALAPHMRFRGEVIEAVWDETRSLWRVQTGDGQTFEAQSLVTATGQLSRPFRPQLPGLASFAGTSFHSAEWPQDCDLRDKSVAVIGTGASAIQFVPEVAPLVRKLYVFQRSAPYVLRKRDRTYSEWQKQAFRRHPIALKLCRAWTYVSHEIRAFAFVTWRAAMRTKRINFFRHLRRGIKDPALRERLTPDYRMGCKRILLSNDFYPALERANVDLITQPIAEIRSDAVITADAAERKVDCIIFGTGFEATNFLAPIRIVGRHGQDLHQSWSGGAHAHLGMTVAGFPNFFMLYGPNTNLSHNSIVYMIESQIRFVVACLARLCSDDIRMLETKKDVQDRFNAEIQRRLENAMWSKGCTSWYLTAEGKNTTNWPGYSFMFRLKTRAPNWDDYAVQ